MKPTCETALTLRRAANVMVQMAAMRRPEPWDRPVADLLYAEAEKAQATFDAVQRPGEYAEDPGGIAQGDPAEADRLAAGHHPHALRIAQAILGIANPPKVVQIKEGLL